MILLIDNYDSFTYNLYQSLSELGAEVNVRLSDRISESDIASAAAVVLSPGPGRPADAGNAPAVLARVIDSVPVLGVCLGHQMIAEHYGAKIVHAAQLRHGKTSRVYHDGTGLYAGIVNPFDAARYHSLVVDDTTLPRCLEVTSYTSDGEIMGLRHKTLPVEGVQFHPESFLTSHGATLLKNFVRRVQPFAHTVQERP
jgi:para-aminobenzoate synthetase component II